MADILLRRDSELAATSVPNTFIDEYMTKADGEFVKIYLYLLRCMSDIDKPFSISDTADRFEDTERDVKRALKYWEKMKLLRLEFNEDEELTSICLMDSAASNGSGTSQMAETSARHTPRPDTTRLPERTAYTRDELSQFVEDETVQELFFITERYLGHPLNNNETQTILYWLDKLRFSQDLIEYLIEDCVSKNHKSIRYMDKVALAWAEQGIHTLAQAREACGIHNQSVHSVIKAFGITGRNLVDYERGYVDKWSKDLGFSSDIIAYACQRTIKSTHQISFEYADSILNSWKKQNVCTIKDIELLDAQYQEAQARRRGANETGSHTARGTTVTRFANFQQRTYDYDKLETELLTR